MVNGAEVSVGIANGLLCSRECLKELIEKPLVSREKRFYEPIKRSNIQITIEKKKKLREISILKKDRQALRLFVAKYPDSSSISSFYSSRKIVQTRTKYSFRNYLIDFYVAFVEIPSELNPVVIYDAMAVNRYVHLRLTWEDLFKILIKVYKLKKSSETILVFDNYTDELEYSLNEQERSDRAGSTAFLRKHIGEISQKNAPR